MGSFWDFFAYIFVSTSDLFVSLYKADKRPEARQTTLGCFTLVLIVSTLVGIYFFLKS